MLGGPGKVDEHAQQQVAPPAAYEAHQSGRPDEQAAAGALTVAVAGVSDRGQVRPINEDAFLVASLDLGLRGLGPELVRHVVGARGSVLAVCDGMGGAAHGEVASAIAVDALLDALAAASLPASDRAARARVLAAAVETAHGKVHAAARRERRLRGMGTTLSAALIGGDALVVAQVGDSRAYLLRRGQLTQLTRDQTVAAALERAGAGVSGWRQSAQADAHTVLQALGVSSEVEVSLSIVELRRGDRLLLCSDGLHGLVPDPLLEQDLAAALSPAAACATLLARALHAGASDNVTIVVAELDGDGLVLPGAEELPRFVEFAPNGRAGHALYTTSRVAHRLARRAGLALQATSDLPTLPAAEERALLAHGDLAPAAVLAPPRPSLNRRTWGLVSLLLVGVAVALAAVLR